MQTPDSYHIYHIRTNACKLNCANKIRNDDNGVDIDNDKDKYVKSVFNNRIITYFIEIFLNIMKRI